MLEALLTSAGLAMGCAIGFAVAWARGGIDHGPAARRHFDASALKAHL